MLLICNVHIYFTEHYLLFGLFGYFLIELKFQGMVFIPLNKLFTSYVYGLFYYFMLANGKFCFKSRKYISNFSEVDIYVFQ